MDYCKVNFIPIYDVGIGIKRDEFCRLLARERNHL